MRMSGRGFTTWQMMEMVVAVRNFVDGGHVSTDRAGYLGTARVR